MKELHNVQNRAPVLIYLPNFVAFEALFHLLNAFFRGVNFTVASSVLESGKQTTLLYWYEQTVLKLQAGLVITFQI